MSRVKTGQKFVNMPHYDQKVYNPSKVKRLHRDGEDYHKADTLSQWLFIKYDMSYKSYRNKKKNTRARLKAEYISDTELSFAGYCRKFGKTPKDIESLSPALKQAWEEEYQMWHDREKRQRQRDSRSQEEKDYSYAMRQLAECGVPFGPDGSPLGIGWDD